MWLNEHKTTEYLSSKLGLDHNCSLKKPAHWVVWMLDFKALSKQYLQLEPSVDQLGCRLATHLAQLGLNLIKLKFSSKSSHVFHVFYFSPTERDFQVSLHFRHADDIRGRGKVVVRTIFLVIIRFNTVDGPVRWNLDVFVRFGSLAFMMLHLRYATCKRNIRLFATNMYPRAPLETLPSFSESMRATRGNAIVFFVHKQMYKREPFCPVSGLYQRPTGHQNIRHLEVFSASLCWNHPAISNTVLQCMKFCKGKYSTKSCRFTWTTPHPLPTPSCRDLWESSLRLRFLLHTLKPIVSLISLHGTLLLRYWTGRPWTRCSRVSLNLSLSVCDGKNSNTMKMLLQIPESQQLFPKHNPQRWFAPTRFSNQEDFASLVRTRSA